jgi:hypothetical protein
MGNCYFFAVHAVPENVVKSPYCRIFSANVGILPAIDIRATCNQETNIPVVV